MSSVPGPSLRWGRWLAGAGLLYSAYTVAYTWPLPLHAWDHVRAAPIWGAIDVDLHLWTLAWVSHTVLTAPRRLFDANVFHPAPLALAGSDHLLGTLPVAGPVYWVTGNPVVTLNAVVLSSFPLVGLAGFALVAAATGSGWAGLLGGFVYAFAPLRTHSFVPVQTFSIQYLPLALLALGAYIRRGRPGFLAAGLAALLLQLLVAYYIAYAALVTLAVWLAAVAAVERPFLLRRWLTLLAGLTVTLGVVAAVSVPYLIRRDAGAIRAYGGALGTSTLLGWLGPGLLQRRANVFLGIVPIGLALVACLPPFRVERRLRRAAGGFLAVALAGWILCLGSHAEIRGIRVPLPYSWLAAIIPGFSSMRVALRFFTVVTLGIGGLAAVGLERVRGWLWPPLRAAVALTLVGLALWEYRPLEWPMPLHPVPTGDAVPAAYRWLAAHGAGGPLLEFPVDEEHSFTGTLHESHAMYFSTVHWLPLLNGYTAYPPPSHELLMRVARQLPEPESIETLVNLAGVRWILVHLDDLPALERGAWTDVPGLAPAARFGGDVVFAVTRARSADWQRALLEPEAGRTVGGVATTALPPGARAGRIEAVALPGRMTALGGEAVVRLTNLSAMPWPGIALAEDGLVRLAVRWETARATPAVHTIGLARDLAPGASEVIRFSLRPPAPGVYRLTLALRQGDEPFPEETAPALVRTVEVSGTR